MAAFLGQLVGGVLAMYLFSKLVEWAFVKRVLDDPIMGAVTSVVIAYFLAVLLYGFGSANGGPWRASGLLLYLPGAVVVGIARPLMRKRKLDQQEAVELE